MAASGGERKMPLLNEPHQPSLSFLTADELFHTSDVVKSKVLQVLTELSRSGFASENQRRNDKITFEQQIFGLENELREKTVALENANIQLQSERQNTENYVEKYRTTLSQLNRCEEQLAGKESEISSLKVKNECIGTEKNDLLTVLERRAIEIEKLTADLKATNEHLQGATVAKIEALAKVDELTSKEIDLDYKEKQLEKEKEWVSKQVSLLQEELERKNIQVIEIQREFNLKNLGIQTELADKTEELRITQMSLAATRRTNEDQELHIERLLEKLKEAQDMELKLQENFRQELKSQRRIADLYKESSEEAGKKVEELEDAVTNLQALLKQAADKYGELETQFRDSSVEWETQICDRDTTIKELQQELADANELLSNIRKQGMTDEMIASLSPAAAAASAMLKDSQSLTEIYSRYQKVYTDLVQAKDDNEKLNSYVQQILKEITDRTPGLRRQKEDYERSLGTIEALQDQLDLSLQEISDFKIDNAHLKKTVGTLERENGRLNSQIKDMAIQIRSLVKEVESNRGNYSFDEQDSSVVPDVSENSSELGSSRLITERLVTFRNIDELQAQNQHLLAVVRELSEAQEAAEKNTSDEKLREFKETLASARAEIDELKATKSRHESMIESLNQQRDTLTALLSQQRSPLPGDKRTSMDGSSGMEKIVLLEKKIEEKQLALAKLQEEFDTYRREKGLNDKLANEQMEKLRDDVVRMRSENARLACQSEYSTERAKNYTSNLESYKKNIAVLEEKSKQYQTTILKHEQSIEIMKHELANTQQSLARAEVALSSAVQERNLLRDAKARLQAERDLFQREHSTQQILQVNLEEIKNGLEMANSAVRIRLENQVEQLQKENVAYRRMHDTENDKFRETVLAWDKTNKDLQSKVEIKEKLVESLQEELTISQNTIRTQRKEIEELLNKVSLLTGNSAVNSSLHASASTLPSPSRSSFNTAEGDTSREALEQRAKDLTLQLVEAQSECKSMRQQLDLARGNLEEYKSLAQAMEDQLNSANSTSKNFSEELAERLACKDDIIRDIQARLDAVDKENTALREEKEVVTKDHEDKLQFMNEEINRMRRELQTANSKLQSLTEENCSLKTDIEQQSQLHKDVKEKYERELTSHAQDVKTGGEIKAELDGLRQQADEAARARMYAEETLNSSLKSWDDKEKAYISELTGLRENLNELEKLNVSLQDQLISLTTQVTSLRKLDSSTTEDTEPSSADTSLNASLSENDVKHSEQWLQLVRYLRREKEIAKTRAEMAQTAADRLESKLKFVEKQFAEVQQQLTEMQDKSHVSVITSAKQNELLRKVETLSALTDSNRMLREEKEAAIKEIETLNAKLQKLEADITPLRAQNAEYESKCDALGSENVSLRQDAGRWRARASALLEKCNKVNPEELKKLQTEKDLLQKQLTTLQETCKKQQQEVARFNLQIKNMQQNLSAQQTSNASLLSEKKLQLDEQKKSSEQILKLKSDLDASQAETTSTKTTLTLRESELAKLRTELDEKQKLVERQKQNVISLKNIAKKYKKQYEDMLEENKILQISKAESDGLAAGSSSGAAKTSADGSTNTADDDENRDASSDETLRQEISKQEGRVSELAGENESLKRDIENVKSDSVLKEERAKLAMKSLREKLNQLQQQKSDAEVELNDFKQKLSQAEASSEETLVRFAAIKSQLEGRLTKLEKENKDLRTAGMTSGGDGSSSGVSELNLANANLVEENNRMKKELEMLRPRISALEKQLKLHTQQQGVKGSPAGSDKPQVEPPKANIKPIAGTSTGGLTKQVAQGMSPAGSRLPLTASIRPMSMQRKATVMPTAATAMQTPQHATVSSQPQQSFQGGPGTSQAMFVAPVSQAQVSTSTPDQSSGTDHTLHLPATSSVSTPTIGNSAMVRQATVNPTPAVTVTPISTASAMGTQAVSLQGPSGDRDTGETSGTHEDPSTSSHIEDLELGDSSEQVSSSEPSNHQQGIPVAPVRSQQDQVQPSNQTVSGTNIAAVQGGSSSSAEEPSPSTSTTALRPSQSGKRGRENEVETSQEQPAGEPDNKRSRINMPMPIEREAEAMSHQQEDFIMDENLEDREQEADQGGNDEDQDPHSENAGKSSCLENVQTDSQEDDDSDVIIIDSDVEELDENSEQVRGHGEEMEENVEEEEEDLEDEGEEEDDEDDGEEEDSNVESGTDEGGEDNGDDDDDDDNGGDEAHGELGEDTESQDGHQDEGREAESMEGQDGSQNPRASEDEADAVVIELDEEFDQQDEEEESGDHGRLSTGVSIQSTEFRPSAEAAVVAGPSGASAATSTSTTEFWGHNSSLRPNPVPLSRPGRQERLPSIGRQHQLTPGGQISSQFDDMDESIVPSTPTLFVPRRNDGFAEAVSSPQVPPQRFIFTTQGDVSTQASATGADETRIEVHAYDDGSGRSVPTTPLQVSPPETVEIPSNMNAQTESTRDAENRDVSPEVQDVQPSSSDSSRFQAPKISEVPSITVTYAMDNSLDSSPDVNLENDGAGNSQVESEANEGGLNANRPEASVTSSDEDKIDGTSSTAGLPNQSSAASSSSGTASPTPSSNTLSQSLSADGSQQHRVRPTPIVWDQPTSSSSVPAAPPRPAVARRGRVATGRPLGQPIGELASVMPVRGGFRPLRGAQPQPSARRSRPSTRGAVRGSPFSKGPY